MLPGLLIAFRCYTISSRFSFLMTSFPISTLDAGLCAKLLPISFASTGSLMERALLFVRFLVFSRILFSDFGEGKHLITLFLLHQEYCLTNLKPRNSMPRSASTSLVFSGLSVRPRSSRIIFSFSYRKEEVRSVTGGSRCTIEDARKITDCKGDGNVWCPDSYPLKH